MHNETEIISAILTTPSTGEGIQSELLIKKADVDQKLQRFINTADKMDYSVAIASGIICGIFDSLFVGELSITKQDMALSHKQLNEFIQKTAEKAGYKGKRLDGAVGHLENTYPVAQDNVWKGAGIGVSAKEHHLADFAHHPTPLGLVSSIIVQFLRIGFFVNNDGEIHILPVKTEPGELFKTWIPVVVTGVCNWLVSMAESGIEEKEGVEIPKPIKELIRVIANTPIIIEILKVTHNWIGHLASDLAGSKNTAGGGMGISGVFLSLAYELASLPLLKDSGLPDYLNKLYTKQGLDFRHEFPALKIIGKQALVVLFNEAIVRTFYFVRRLVKQISEKNGVKYLDWDQIIPFNNRTILRMTTISSATFTMTDLIDAGVRGAVESAGNWAVFAAKFISRVNFVGAGRLAISVVAEAKSQQEELDLLRENRIITEQLSAQNVSALISYREKINSLVEEYLADDLESFLGGFKQMKEGINSDNSDLFIGGNVVIQRKLGREIQFSNQSEFDELMLSDEALKL